MNNDDKIRSKLFPKHINVLVKNQKGLKDLYHLVSLTHTKTLYREPVLEKSVLEQYRDNFFSFMKVSHTYGHIIQPARMTVPDENLFEGA